MLTACSAIRARVARGDISDGMVFDAVRMQLVEIGEAVKDASHGSTPPVREVSAGYPWHPAV